MSQKFYALYDVKTKKIVSKIWKNKGHVSSHLNYQDAKTKGEGKIMIELQAVPDKFYLRKDGQWIAFTDVAEALYT